MVGMGSRRRAKRLPDIHCLVLNMDGGVRFAEASGLYIFDTIYNTSQVPFSHAFFSMYFARRAIVEQPRRYNARRSLELSFSHAPLGVCRGYRLCYSTCRRATATFATTPAFPQSKMTT
jgi:hypothetical protein